VASMLHRAGPGKEEAAMSKNSDFDGLTVLITAVCVIFLFLCLLKGLGLAWVH